MPSAAEFARRLQEPAAVNLPELVRLDEVAKALSVTERHLRRLIAERRIPFVRVGYFIRFDPDAIARWVAEHRVEVQGQPGRRR